MTEREIAVAADFRSATTLAKIKSGEVRLPLDRVTPLAQALEVDSDYLFRLALEQYLGVTHGDETRQEARAPTDGRWLGEQ